jgi:predicted nucleic acid-binding Zn ribbon protein
VRQRRSPSQHFCSQECRRAMERVWERERHWQRTRAG